MEGSCRKTSAAKLCLKARQPIILLGYDRKMKRMPWDMEYSSATSSGSWVCPKNPPKWSSVMFSMGFWCAPSFRWTQLKSQALDFVGPLGRNAREIGQRSHHTLLRMRNSEASQICWSFLLYLVNQNQIEMGQYPVGPVGYCFSHQNLAGIY